MLDIKLCPECKVPEPFYQGQVWLDNGDIVQRLNEKARLILLECESLDPMFENIARIIGLPIDRIIINTTARATKYYLDRLIPKELKEMIKSKIISPNHLIDSITTYCQVIGYGGYEFVDYSYNNSPDDFSKLRIMKPFCVPEAAGALTGAISASVGGEHKVDYEEISPGLYEFVTHWTEYHEVFKEKLQIHEYSRRGGDIEWEKCPSCGCPKALRDFKWRLDWGIIVNSETGRRMALLGPELLDPIFKALEQELGETIPEVVVEAQRRFVRTGFYSIDILETEESLRNQLALRGLGNLKAFKVDKRGAFLSLDNACMHLILAGLIQGNFELAFDVDSDIEWELTEEGDLDLEVTPKKAIGTACL